VLSKGKRNTRTVFRSVDPTVPSSQCTVFKSNCWLIFLEALQEKNRKIDLFSSKRYHMRRGIKYLSVVTFS